jgi:glyoxylase-like metal-dependent hydrolase (beta-lactamase superfamily II)
MKMKSRIMVLLVLCMAFNLVHAQEAKRSISKVAGDVYRFQNNFHVNVFVITGEGVVVTDPIDADATLWLTAEIAKMTDEPITQLVYSHSHGDHASGGLAYDEVPSVIVHANAPDEIDGIEPTLRFSETMQFIQGNNTFELTYLGPGHGKDLIAMVIRPENVGFVVDAVSSKRLFYRDFPNANIDDWINQVRKVQSLEFDILVGGHGPVGVKSDVDDALAYLQELRAAVLKGLKDGKSVDELSESIKMEKYRDWANYDSWLKLNIQGMARDLKQSGAVD